MGIGRQSVLCVVGRRRWCRWRCWGLNIDAVDGNLVKVLVKEGSEDGYLM